MRNASMLAQLLALAGEHVVVAALVQVGRGCGVVESTTICRGGGGSASTGDTLGATVTSRGATHDDGGVASARGGGVDDGGTCVSTGCGAALSARGGVVGGDGKGVGTGGRGSGSAGGGSEGEGGSGPAD